VNWKNVARLINVDVKSGRLIRGRGVRKYRESRILNYILYGGASALGLTLGLAAGIFYIGLSDTGLKGLIAQTYLSFSPSLPTFVFIYSLVFAMMGQIQKMGVQSSIKLPYWLPISWKEHTLASILTNLIGIPLALLMGISLALISFSIFLGQAVLAVMTVLTLIASSFLASATAESFSILQTRFMGAIYKSSGKAAVWIRFGSSLVSFILFYIVWIFLTSGAGALLQLQAVVEVQSTIWYIPYIWPGIILASAIKGLIITCSIFSLATITFILAFFYAAVQLNSRFGLYEPPAITVSKGIYAPKVSAFRKLGYSSVETALIGKDIKALTRRRELISIFIVPIVFMIIPLMQYLGLMGVSVTAEASPFLAAELILGPGTFMALMLGSMIIGEEGASVWLLYASPINSRSLVRCKYTVIVILSSLVSLVCSVLSGVIASPTITLYFAALSEAFLIIFAVSAASLLAGIKGADFTETPRPRMVRPTTALMNAIVCLLVSLAILLPLIPYAIGLPLFSVFPGLDLYLGIVMSAIISAIFTFLFYRLALKSAETFLNKAEA
jgi:hypothetical protein